MTRTQALWITALVLAVVAVVPYLGTIGNEFVWDDPIVFDRQLPFFDTWSNVFMPPKGIPQFGEHYYRPLGVVSYLIDEGIAKRWWKLEERDKARRIVFHASPVIYHTLATQLVFLTGIVLLGLVVTVGLPEIAAAAAAAILFAVHPIHVESVAWMAGRSDVICGLFFLGALLAYVRYRRRGGLLPLIGSALLAFGAMLCKEAGLGVLLVVPFVDWLVVPAAAGTATLPSNRAERRRKEREGTAGPRPALRLPLAAGYGLFGLVTLVYLALRHNAIAAYGSPALSVTAHWERLAGAIGWYVVKTFWAPPQSAYIDTVPGGMYAFIGVFAVAATIAGFVLPAALGRRAPDFAPELLALALYWGALALSLAISLFPISKTPLAERYVYIPSAGALLLVFLLLRRALLARPAWPAWIPAAVPLGLAILVALPATGATVAREKVWSNNLQFWTDAVKGAPESGVPHLHLGMTYGEMGKDEQAIEQYKLALKYYTNPVSRAKAYNDLGSEYLKLKRFDESIEQFKLAIKEDGNYETPHYNWSIALLNIAQDRQGPERERLIAEAQAHLETALRILPRYVKANLQYGSLLLRGGRAQEGLTYLQRVIELAPASPEAKDARRILSQVKARPSGAPVTPANSTPAGTP